MLLDRFLLAADMALGVKGLMLADLFFSVEVESHSADIEKDGSEGGGALAHRCSSFSSNRSRVFCNSPRGVDRGEEMGQEVLGEDIQSNRRIALTALVGGEGDWMGEEGIRPPGRLGQD